MRSAEEVSEARIPGDSTLFEPSTTSLHQAKADTIIGDPAVCEVDKGMPFRAKTGLPRIADRGSMDVQTRRHETKAW